MSRILLTGATGLVGGHLLRLLVEDARISEIIAPTRRPLAAMPRVVNLVGTDLTDMLRRLQPPLDLVFCCLGTTLKRAGSKTAFVHVDYTLVVDTALTGQRLGAKQMLVVSAHLASSRSLFFYNKVKGEMERALRHQGWPRLTLVRPSLLLGDRDAKRTGESLMAPLFARLPGNWRAVAAPDVAQAMLDNAFAPSTEAVSVVESAQIPRGRAFNADGE